MIRLALALVLLAAPAAADEPLMIQALDGPVAVQFVDSGPPDRADAPDATCRLWFDDGRLETTCVTSSQMDRVFDYLRPIIDSYIARERAEECQP